jgi:hypothetical protein
VSCFIYIGTKECKSKNWDNSFRNGMYPNHDVNFPLGNKLLCQLVTVLALLVIRVSLFCSDTNYLLESMCVLCFHIYLFIYLFTYLFIYLFIRYFILLFS